MLSVQDCKEEADGTVNKVLTTISASFSLLGAFSIIATFIAWKDFRSYSRQILVYISIADFFIAAGNLLGVWEVDANNKVCKAQSFVTICGTLWSFFWTSFLAIFMYTVVARKQAHKGATMFKIFHIIGWLVPLSIAIIALALGKLGNAKHVDSAGWCWTGESLGSRERQLWMFFTGKSWEIAAYILSSTFFLMLKFHIRKEVYGNQKQFATPQSKQTAIKAEKRLILVPIIFILVRIWGTLRFFIYVFGGVERLNTTYGIIFLYLQGIGDSSQGFANFLLFCFFTEKFQVRVQGAVQKLFACCNRESNHSSMVELEVSAENSRRVQQTNERSPLLAKRDIEQGS